jgi:hypothetical protein
MHIYVSMFEFSYAGVNVCTINRLIGIVTVHEEKIYHMYFGQLVCVV